jgi:hypothetical protein
MYIQSTNSSILKNLCQAKQKNHNNKKKMNINLLQHLWLTHDHDRIDQMLLLSIEYIYKQLDHKKNVFKNEYIEDTNDVGDKMAVEE